MPLHTVPPLAPEHRARTIRKHQTGMNRLNMRAIKQPQAHLRTIRPTVRRPPVRQRRGTSNHTARQVKLRVRMPVTAHTC